MFFSWSFIITSENLTVRAVNVGAEWLPVPYVSNNKWMKYLAIQYAITLKEKSDKTIISTEQNSSIVLSGLKLCLVSAKSPLQEGL